MTTNVNLRIDRYMGEQGVDLPPHDGFPPAYVDFRHLVWDGYIEPDGGLLPGYAPGSLGEGPVIGNPGPIPEKS